MLDTHTNQNCNPLLSRSDAIENAPYELAETRQSSGLGVGSTGSCKGPADDGVRATGSCKGPIDDSIAAFASCAP